MKHLHLWIYMAMAVAACACGTKNNKEQDSEVGKKRYEVEKNPVDTMVLYYRDFNSQLVSNGKLRAVCKASLKFPSSGRIEVLNVKNGTQVGAGDVIAIQDSRDAGLRLEQAQSQMEKAGIELEDKLLGYGFKLKDSASIPHETMRIARIHSGYNDAVSGLKGAKLAFDNCTLKAPVSGRVANLATKLYEFPSGEEFCAVIDDKTFEVEFFVLESELSNLKEGQSVLVSTFTEPGRRYQGRVTEINPVVNDKGQVTARAQFQNPGHLMDGMNVKVYVENLIAHKLVVPKSAVLIRDNQEVLFRVDKEGKAMWTYVHIVMSNSDSYVVVPNVDKGAELNEGDVVIISGNLNLAHGSGVVVK